VLALTAFKVNIEELHYTRIREMESATLSFGGTPLNLSPYDPHGSAFGGYRPACTVGNTVNKHAAG
jgi:hypothetical protein